MIAGAKNAGLLLRVAAKGLDFILILAVSEALPKAGWLAGAGYLLISDGLFDGRSIGKKLTGLRVVSASTGMPGTTKESILRNGPLALGALLWRIPFIGWLFLLAVMALEFVLLLGSSEGMRLGDEIAKTHVVETIEATQEK